MMTVLRHDDQRGGLAYPFLPDDQPWQIVTRPFGDEAALARILQAADPETGTAPAPATGSGPALRWVKDDKVLDLYFPGLDTPAFLARSGLRLSLHKGGTCCPSACPASCGPTATGASSTRPK